MSAYQNPNHLIMRRVRGSFNKTRDFQDKTRRKKDNNSLISDDGMNMNLSMDVKNHMLR